MTKIETQGAPRVAVIMGSKSDSIGRSCADAEEVAESIEANLERHVAARPGERAWT